MSEEKYLRMYEGIRRSWIGVHLINVVDLLITIVTFLAYPLLLLYLYSIRSESLTECIMVPAVGFVIVSLFRKSYNAKRPYEAMNIEPIIRKDTCGRSFPSRHVFSIFIIAMAYGRVDTGTAAIFMFLGAMLGAIRVFGGVHYIRDVLFGALIGILFGFIGFSVIHWPNFMGLM